VEFTLAAAERLLAQAAEDASRLARARVVASALIFAAACVVVGFVALAPKPGALREFVALAVVVVLAVPLVLGLWRLAATTGRAFDPQKLRLATDLAALVSAVYLDVAEREQWSYVRLQATKLRLSTFPLSASTHKPREVRSRGRQT
jgi:hypothetical protein